MNITNLNRRSVSEPLQKRQKLIHKPSCELDQSFVELDKLVQAALRPSSSSVPIHTSETGIFLELSKKINRGDYDEAAQQFREQKLLVSSIGMKSFLTCEKTGDFCYSLASLYVRKKEYSFAKKAIDEGLNKQCTPLTKRYLLTLLGDVFFKEKQMPEAIDAFEKAFFLNIPEKNTTLLASFLNWGEALLSQQRFFEAELVFGSSTDYRFDETDAVQRCLAVRRNYLLALASNGLTADFSKAIVILEKDVDGIDLLGSEEKVKYYHFLAKCHLSEGHVTQAVSYLALVADVKYKNKDSKETDRMLCQIACQKRVESMVREVSAYSLYD